MIDIQCFSGIINKVNTVRSDRREADETNESDKAIVSGGA